MTEVLTDDNIQRIQETESLEVIIPEVTGEPPGGRGGHTSTVVGDRMFVFGGHYLSASGDFLYSNEMFVFSNSTWKRLRPSPSDPSPRCGHSASLIDDHRLLVFGGRTFNKRVLRDLWMFDTRTLKWQELARPNLTTPSARHGHSCVYYNSYCYFFGGVGEHGNFFSDLYSLNTKTFEWKKIPCASTPSPRAMHAAVLLPGGKMLVHGGMGENGIYLGDMHEMDLEISSWRRVYTKGIPPLPRFGHSLNFYGNFLILFGGWSGVRRRCVLCGQGEGSHDRSCELSSWTIAAERGDEVCWRIDLEHYEFFAFPELSGYKNPKEVLESCFPRYGHSAVFLNNQLMVFGGWDGGRSVNTLQIIKHA